MTSVKCECAFQCAKNLVSGKIGKPTTLTVFKRLGHDFRREMSWFSNHNRNDYPPTRWQLRPNTRGP